MKARTVISLGLGIFGFYMVISSTLAGFNFQLICGAVMMVIAAGLADE